MDFRQQIKNLAQSKSNILEIGPSYNPILPKSEGFPVKIIDHASRYDLIQKYQEFGIDTSKIEEVDYVSTDIGLLKSEGLVFDMIIGSHVIEHVPDFIKFLNDCNSLLGKQGCLALIVPDKRYCFDIFRPLSSPGSMIDAYYTKRKLHIGGLFDHYLYFSRNHGNMAWGSEDLSSSFEFPHTALISRDAISKSLTDIYVDAHEWVFVPSSFYFIVSTLREAGFIDTGILDYQKTAGYEFFALLSQSAPLNSISVKDMVSAIQKDLTESYILYQNNHASCIERQSCQEEDKNVDSQDQNLIHMPSLKRLIVNSLKLLAKKTR